MSNMLPHRTELGKRFTEGARQLWATMTKREWSQATLAREIGASLPAVHRWLYGDQLPGIGWAQKIQERLRIPMATWTEAAREPFALPATLQAAPPAKARKKRKAA